MAVMIVGYFFEFCLSQPAIRDPHVTKLTPRVHTGEELRTHT